MKHIIIYIFGFLLLTNTLLAQIVHDDLEIVITDKVDYDKKDYRSKTDYKKAKAEIKAGDEAFMLGRGGYRMAIEHYSKAFDLSQKNAFLDLKLGFAYLNSIEKTKCLLYFEKAFQNDPGVSPYIYYLLARGYHLTYKFDKAISYYNKYKSTLSPKTLKSQEKIIAKRIAECNTGKELVKKPIRVFIDNIGDSVNSSYPEYSPLITADESEMIFTSRRPDSYGGLKTPDEMFFEDIYRSEHRDNNKWGKAQNVGKPLNTKDHDATVGFSADGQSLFIYKGSEGNGDIFVSHLKGMEWDKPSDKTTKKYINTEYHEPSASFSYDGQSMYFVSNRTDLSYGGHDIFISHWDAKKQRWGKPQNLGNTINTEYDEDGCFIHPDGRTLYFSSKGHNTMGGYDIFKSELQDDGTWSEPENLGYPVNTPNDDVFFVMAANGKHGYYASAQKGGYGDYDIYKITFRGPEKPTTQSNEDQLLASTGPLKETVMEAAVKVKTMRLTIVKGTVKDANTLEPLEAQVEIVDNEKNQVVQTLKSNAATGRFLVSLPSGKNYGFNVKKEGYLFYSENFNIPKATGYQQFIKDILLNKMSVGTKVVLRNIFFDFAKATLRPESFAELDRLIDLLNKYPNLRIEISGHTDNRGSLKLNTKLSAARAKAVVDYLIGKGIAASRLESKGYAYLQPIASNDTDEGRQQNRRVEFKVLSN